MNLYKFIEILHDILIQWELCGDEKKIQLYAYGWHFKKFLMKEFGCPEGCFLRVWVSERWPDALLTKTMGDSLFLFSSSPQRFSEPEQASHAVSMLNRRDIYGVQIKAELSQNAEKRSAGIRRRSLSW